jgi:hypothetical protein
MNRATQSQKTSHSSISQKLTTTLCTLQYTHPLRQYPILPILYPLTISHCVGSIPSYLLPKNYYYRTAKTLETEPRGFREKNGRIADAFTGGRREGNGVSLQVHIAGAKGPSNEYMLRYTEFYPVSLIKDASISVEIFLF